MKHRQWRVATAGAVVGALLLSQPALGQHSGNATILPTERPAVDGGQFTALGQAAAANLFTGDATLAIPLQVPPGRGQATPALSLSYSSSSGDGPLGLGWSMALGAVMRSTMNGVPTCTEDHEFTLSIPGATVELVHATGSSPPTYYAKVDEAYIEATADTTTNEWTVHDRAGRTYRFGTDASARAWTGSDVFMDETGCGFTAVWTLTQVSDPNANVIDFTYTNSGNAPLIDEIRYGANPSAGLEEHPFKIEFQPIARTYPHVSHRLGVPQTFAELIDQIDVRYRKSASDSTYYLDRTYTLTYAETPNGGRALLEQIEATGLPPRTFTYVGPDVQLVREETRSNPFIDGSMLLSEATDSSNSVFRLENVVLDMNGDGIVDAVRAASPNAVSWNVYLGDGTGFASTPIAWDVSQLPSGFRAVRDTLQIRPLNKTRMDTVDITGDGIPDWVDARSSSQWTVYPGRCTSSTACGFLAGVAWPAPQEYLGLVNITNFGSEIQRAVIDLNGDGYADYVEATGSSQPWIVHLGTASGFESSPTDFDATGWIGIMGAPVDIPGCTSPCPGYTATTRRVFDFNGDGLPDLLTVAESGHWVNADGELDGPCGGSYCTGTNALEVRLNTGSGFASSPVVSSLGSNYFGYISFEFAKQEPDYGLPFTLCTNTSICYERVESDFLDVNGDGLPDYVRAPGGFAVDYQVLLNVGGGKLETGPDALRIDHFETFIKRIIPGLSLPQPTGRPLRMRLSQRINGVKSTRYLSDLLDLNGDGLVELVEVDDGGQTWSSRTVGAPLDPLDPTDPNDPLQPPARLVTAEDGAGGETGFRYAVSTRFDNGGADGAPDLPFPRWVTSAIRQTDGLCTPGPTIDVFDPSNECLVGGHERLRRYEYVDGRFDAVAREFRGFGMVTEIDSNGNETETIFSQADYTRGKVLEQTVRAVGGATSHDLRIVKNVWQVRGGILHADRTQVYLAQTSTEERGVPDNAADRMCSLSRNAPPDDYGRVSQSCTYECATAPTGICETPVAGQQISSTLWANPTSGSHVRERPKVVWSFYVKPDLSLKMLSGKSMRYDGTPEQDPLPEGSVAEGNVRWVASWLDQSVIGGSYPGWLPPIRMEYDAYGNLTSTTDEKGNTRSSLFDDEFFSIHPVTQIAPMTAGIAHEIDIVTSLRFGKPTLVTDENLQVTELRYDDLGRLTCEARPGDIAAMCDFDLPNAYKVLSRRVAYSFGNPQAATFEGKLTKVDTRIPSLSSPLGYVGAVRYFDALGRERFTKVHRTIGNADPAAAPQTVIEGQVEFDSEGRPVEQFAPYLAATAHQDPAGALVPATTLTYQLNETTLIDPLGRVHKVDPPDDQEVTTTYLARTTTSIDASGARAVTRRDHLGRTVATESHDSGGRVIGTNVTYDGAGRVLTRRTVEDASTEVSFVYDTLGRQVAMTDPNTGGTWLYGYDVVGNLVYVDDPKPSQHVQSFYDELNRVVRRCTYPSDAFDPSSTSTYCGVGAWESSYAYDEVFVGGHGIGRLTTAMDAHGAERFWYDNRGRIAKRERRIGPTEGGIIAATSFLFDAADRVMKVTYPDGDIVDYGYGAAGQLISIEGVVQDIDYDFMGRSTTVVRSNGTTDRRTYYGSVEGFRLQDVETIVTASPSTAYLDLTYGYNDIAKVSTVTDHRDPVGSPPSPLSNSAVYGYDTIGRLESITGSSFDDAFAFDGVGNLTAKSGNTLDYSTTSGPHQVGAYGDEVITYDGNGNRKQKDGPGTKLETYTYNALDQLVHIGVNIYFRVDFTYDYAGRRLTKLVNSEPSTRILYFSEYAESQGGTLTKHFYAGGVLIASSHVDVSMAGSPAPALEIPIEGWLALGGIVAALLLGAGLVPVARGLPERVLAVRAVGAVLLVLSTGPPVLLLPGPASAGGGGGGPPPPYLGMRHYHVDRLGSTQVVTDDLGAIVQQVRYDAYGAIRTRVDAAGNPIIGSASNDARRTFTGYEDEYLSDLQYAGARFYDPELGQFLTHDPAAQFPSPYAYGPGDPANGTDPSGALFGIDDALLIAIAIWVGASAAFAAAQAYVSGGNPLQAGLVAAGLGVLGAGLGIAVGAAGAAIGTDSQVMGLVTNPLVQDSLAAVSAGLPVASAAAGDDAGQALGFISAALSLSLAFSSGASSNANGAKAASAASEGETTPLEYCQRPTAAPSGEKVRLIPARRPVYPRLRQIRS